MSEWEEMEGWLGLPLRDDEEYGLMADMRLKHAGRGREFFLEILRSFRSGREIGYQEARFEWGTE